LTIVFLGAIKLKNLEFSHILLEVAQKAIQGQGEATKEKGEVLIGSFLTLI